jgi:tetratricopeptide (TPR) repeat protein
MADDVFARICFELGSKACQRGDYALTYMLYQHGFAPPSSEDSEAIAGSLKKIGELYAEQKRYKEAVKFYKKALAVYGSMTAINKLCVRDVLDKLAGLFCKQGRYGQATRLYRRAMEIDEDSPEKNLDKMQERLRQMSWLNLRQGKMQDAQALCGLTSRIQNARERAH